jgi:dGTPase
MQKKEKDILDILPIYSKDKLERFEEEHLAPYAMKSRRAQRTIALQDEGRHFDYRTEFQRDRDRIIHSRAFRRLKHKTQVYVPYEGDHHRTRLTHTIEVSQISRTLVRALNLNEDLTEAIALAHDLGHTPFGHTGEVLLNQIMQGKETLDCLDTKLMQQAGGFKHNYQSLRVVDKLEKRYKYDGLNLTNETREGIIKHTDLDESIRYPDLKIDGLNIELPPFLEAQVVSMADEIAQQSHDLEDGLMAKEVPLEKVEMLKIAQEVISKISKSYKREKSRYLRQNMLIRGIIHLLVTNIIMHSAEAIKTWAEKNDIKCTEDFYQKRAELKPDLIDFSSEGKKLFAEMKSFIYQYIINSFSVNRADGRARHFLKHLFRAYYLNPRQLESYVLLRFKEMEGVAYLRDLPIKKLDAEIKQHYQKNLRFIRLICDHIAGMSDQYALREYEKLFLPHPGMMNI